MDQEGWRSASSGSSEDWLRDGWPSVRELGLDRGSKCMGTLLGGHMADMASHQVDRVRKGKDEVGGSVNVGGVVVVWGVAVTEVGVGPTVGLEGLHVVVMHGGHGSGTGQGGQMSPRHGGHIGGAGQLGQMTQRWGGGSGMGTEVPVTSGAGTAFTAYSTPMITASL
ncbi:hypothetical protein CC1G_14560 [Coprinopsis cinerea okayama7|uniref:Uncharacterized protein n=1 Tax=Coprinopsis cinerea (strain Okayama-7 / 130 / ATCC MYA-4618 / FGSC 9003) TaxID=240176 RepID=D6RMN2_COPC7|nr:hypothetical protein CC1G_14560 [Coprinopsis cinerea okayama7\|eukprot:XP_002911128.1 hypothetical protein CC1G_14560 [Coprinopsis cinerea okayama7\